MSEFATFHQSLKFGDSGMKFMTQKSKGNQEEKKKSKEIDPVAKVEPKVEAQEIVPVVQAPVVQVEPEVIEYVDDKTIKPLMGNVVRKPKPRKKNLLPQGDEAEVWHYSMEELYKKIKVTEDFVPIKPDAEFIKVFRGDFLAKFIKNIFFIENIIALNKLS